MQLLIDFLRPTLEEMVVLASKEAAASDEYRAMGYLAFSRKAISRLRVAMSIAQKHPEGLLATEVVQTLCVVVTTAFQAYHHVRGHTSHLETLDDVLVRVVGQNLREIPAIGFWLTIDPAGPLIMVLATLVRLAGELESRRTPEAPEDQAIDVLPPDHLLDAMVLHAMRELLAVLQDISLKRQAIRETIAAMAEVTREVIASGDDRIKLILDMPVTGAIMYRVTPGLAGRQIAITEDNRPVIACAADKALAFFEVCLAEESYPPELHQVETIMRPKVGAEPEPVTPG